MNCSICKLITKKSIDSTVFYCNECDHYQYFPTKVEETFNHATISESLENLRNKNAVTIFRQYSNIFPVGIRFVEVGAGTGYLIRKFQQKAQSVTAVDVDNTFEEFLKEQGVNFVHLKHDEMKTFENYDCFLSSHFLEHIKDPVGYLKTLKKSKVKYLVIEVPSSEGIIFRISKVLYPLGFRTFWDRMFQKESNSPHLQYFSIKSAERLLSINNYTIVKRINIPLVDKFPNFKRIAATESKFISIIISLLLPMLEFINFLTNTSDVKVYFAELQNSDF